MLDKINLRKKFLGLRDAIAKTKRIEFSLAACQNASCITELQQVANKTIAGFFPIKSEIDIRPLLANLQTRGANICLPFVDGNDLQFRQLQKNSCLQPAGFGTLAPSDSAKKMLPDILLVPLSVFDRRGGRLGYGKGFYDRAINKIAKPLLIGMAFAEQETSNVPMESHDHFLHFVITQHEVIKCAC